jgi:Heterokaryon incompatibility protein (HET)
MPVTRQKSASYARFAYSPLDRAIASSFRVVTLLPGEYHTPLSCTLSHEDWRNPAAAYESVSYSWGDRLHTKNIHLNGHPFAVTANLESALRHLRHEHPGRLRRLWVDAICINQGDNQERSQQVRQMYHIYNQAEQVIVWLGDANVSSCRALTFLNESLAPCFESVGFSFTDEQANIASRFWEEWDEGDNEMKRWKAIDHLVAPRHAKIWSSVAALLCRPWWSRAWTVQELISAQKATVVCGKQSLPWPLLDMTVQMMLREIKIEVLYSARKKDLFCNAVDDAYSFVYERSHRISNGTDPLDFVMLMQLTRYRGCQDPRDKVFSVLSLLSENFQASFSAGYLQTVETVYASAVQSYIQHSADLHILSSCCSSEQASNLNLPSWVPDWGMPFHMSYLGGYYSKQTDYTFCASGTSSAITTFSTDLRTLTVSGLEIDTVHNARLQQSDQEFDYSYDEHSGQEPWCTWDIHKSMAELEQSKTALITRKGESPLRAAFHTLIVDRDPIQGIRKRTLKLTKLKHKLWPSCLEEYLAQVRLWTQHRTLIVSTNGYLALAPSSTLPGDKICILYGLHAPVILRPCANDASYTLIGDAYVHALMDAEALSPRKKAQFTARQFAIQ